MIKWLKCLFYGHDYGKFVGYALSRGDNYKYIAILERFCKKCKARKINKYGNNHGISHCGVKMMAEKLAEEINNSIE